jgi:hypothetical protein
LDISFYLQHFIRNFYSFKHRIHITMNSLVTILSPVLVSGGLTLSKTQSDFPLNPRLSQIEVVNGTPYIYTTISGTESWFPLTQKKRSFVHLQGVTSAVWTISHGLDSDDIMYFAYDENGILQDVQGVAVSSSTLRLNLAESKKGKVIIFASDFITAPSITSGSLESQTLNIGDGTLVVDETGVYIGGVGIIGRLNSLDSLLTAEQVRAMGVEGSLNTLSTTNKSSLVGAINELKGNIATAAVNVDTSILVETNRAKVVEGALTNLQTSTKTNLVDAINSVRAEVGNETLRASNVSGSLVNLTTDVKNNLVSAINSVSQNLVTNSSDLNTIIGSLEALTTSEKGDLVQAINSLKLALSNEALRATTAENLGKTQLAAIVTKVGATTTLSDSVTIETDLIIGGSLTVQGTVTNVNSETINLADNVLLLNSNFVTGVPTENAGLQVSRGGNGILSLITWNETNDNVEIPVWNGSSFDQQVIATEQSNVASASKLQTPRNISVSGDVSGTVAFDGSGDVVINAVVADDSHNHIISNVDGLQVALDGKLGVTANAVTASKLANVRTVTLTGGVTGNFVFDGASNQTLVTTVKDDSHNHIVSNVDGLQGLLDGKANTVHTHDYLASTGVAADSQKLDGRSGADYLQADYLNGYEGLMVNGNKSAYLRTTLSGILPYNAGGSSAIGSGAWPFNAIHSNVFYEGGNPLSTLYASLGSDNTLLGATTFNKNASISNANPVLVLKDSSGSGVTQLGKVSFQDNGAAERAYIGYGSNLTSDLTISNLIGKINVVSSALEFNGKSVLHTGGGSWAGSHTFTGNIVDAATNIGRTATPLTTLTSWSQPIGFSAMVNASTVGFPAGTTHSYWNAMGARDTGGGYAGLLLPYNGVGNIYFGKALLGSDTPIWSTIPFMENDQSWTGIQTFKATTTKRTPLVISGDTSEQGKLGIKFDGNNGEQTGTLTADHVDSNSAGAEYSFNFESNQATTNLLLSGQIVPTTYRNNDFLAVNTFRESPKFVKGANIDRSGNSSALWFATVGDTNHALYNSYYGESLTARGGANSGFDGMVWNVYNGIKIRSGVNGLNSLIVASASAGNANDGTVKLYASNVERLATNTSGVAVNGDFSVSGDLKLVGNDSYIWTPTTDVGFFGVWDSFNSKEVIRYRNGGSLVVSTNLNVTESVSTKSVKLHGGDITITKATIEFNASTNSIDFVFA